MHGPESRHETLLAPEGLDRTPHRDSQGSGASRELPPDLLEQASRRLQVVSLLLAATMFLGNYLGSVLDLFWGDTQFWRRATNWAPGATVITLSLLVHLVARKQWVSPARLMDIGLVLGVVSSYGIAMAEFWGVYSTTVYQTGNYFGLSWVAAWMLSYAVIIPNKPAKTLLALFASAFSVSIVIGLSTKYAGTVIPVRPGPYFFGAIFPYLLCVGMAYVSARVVYRLGAAVSRARELGSYRLIDILGRGGMGEVWRAEHRMLARPAAIKLISPQALGHEGDGMQNTLLARFEREAQATASMRSPHTIELFDFGVSDDGAFYYVMELLDGVDAESLVTRFGPLPAERTIHLLCQVCDSLGEAHEAGLIHRDIKPANIYVCRYGREVDFAKVLDFGLVKHKRDPDEESLKLTAVGSANGTPAYMAPEQVLGDRAVDARTDIYAVGCVGYWLLTGQLVFEGETVMKTMMHHAHTAPTAPSAGSELEIPEALDRVILACLEKDPGRRPQTADDLAEQLTACLASTSWTRDQARRWWEAHLPEDARSGDTQSS